ncbi:MAG: hypothetical protein WKF57_03940 [Nakamurella sp.]
MSRYHRNDTWQSADGTWSAGFYEVAHYPDDPDDEWAVEFSDDFQWVSGGHPSDESAYHAWPGANPGSGDVYEHSPENEAQIMLLEMRAAELEEREAKVRRDRFYQSDYSGPSRMHDPVILKARAETAGRMVASLTRDRFSYRLDGYANTVDLDTTVATRDDLTKRALAAGATDIDDGSAEMLRLLTKLRDDRAGRVLDRWTPYERRRVVQGTLAELNVEIAQVQRRVTAQQAARDKAAKKAAAAQKTEQKTAAAPTSTGSAASGAGRVGAGVPTGGQFAARTHPEADVALD